MLDLHQVDNDGLRESSESESLQAALDNGEIRTATNEPVAAKREFRQALQVESAVHVAASGPELRVASAVRAVATDPEHRVASAVRAAATGPEHRVEESTTADG